MLNRKAHINPPCIIAQGLVIGSGIILTYFAATTNHVKPIWIVVFAIVMFASQFIHMMYGIKNMVGYVLMLIIVFMALITMKVLYSFPATALGQFIARNLVVIVPVFVILDFVRDLID